jgi:hypothetical protein
MKKEKERGNGKTLGKARSRNKKIEMTEVPLCGMKIDKKSGNKKLQSEKVRHGKDGIRDTDEGFFIGID